MLAYVLALCDTHTLFILRTGGKFDQLTGSSITSDILATLDVSGVSKLLNHLMELFCNPISSDCDKDRLGSGLVCVYLNIHGSTWCSDDTEGGHSVQTWCLDQILSVVRNRRLPLSDSLLLSAGKFLLVHAFFSVEDLEDSEEVCGCLSVVLSFLLTLSLSSEGVGV